MPPFEKFAPYLQDPFVLAGLAVFLFFWFSRLIITKGIIKPLPSGKGYAILQLILTYGFVLGLVIILLAFWFKHGEMSRAEQGRILSQMEGEVFANMKVATEIGLNVQTILTDTIEISNILRQPGVPLLSSLFPAENRTAGPNQTTTIAMAREALTKTEKLKASLPVLEQERLAQAASAIRGTIKRTRSTLQSLADPDGRRYVTQHQVWDANQAVLRKVSIYDFGNLQESYARVADIQSGYRIVISHCLEFLDSVAAFFENDGLESQEELLVGVLSHERKMISIVSVYGTMLADEIERLQKLRVALELASSN